MSATTQTVQTFDDLMTAGVKAELVNGKVVALMPSGRYSGRIARRVTRSLEDYVLAGGLEGEAIQDNVGYTFSTPLPSGRQSLSPDSSFLPGPVPPAPMPFVKDEPPSFAVEVRSESDYGPAKDRDYAIKRKDYFFAGSQVVWDVDPKAKTVTVYRADDPLAGLALTMSDTADAEPVVPGWRVAVADLFV